MTGSRLDKQAPSDAPKTSLRFCSNQASCLARLPTQITLVRHAHFERVWFTAMRSAGILDCRGGSAAPSKPAATAA